MHVLSFFSSSVSALSLSHIPPLTFTSSVLLSNSAGWWLVRAVQLPVLSLLKKQTEDDGSESDKNQENTPIHTLTTETWRVWVRTIIYQGNLDSPIDDELLKTKSTRSQRPDRLRHRLHLTCMCSCGWGLCSLCVMFLSHVLSYVVYLYIVLVFMFIINM